MTKGTQISSLSLVTYDWNEEKNKQLKERRGISFEEIVLCLQENRLLIVLEHLNRDRYPGQRLYLIEYKQRIYVVPFVVDAEEEVIFLKTIYPSRHYTKRYLEPTDEENR